MKINKFARYLIIIPIIIILVTLPFSFMCSVFFNTEQYSKINADGYTVCDTFNTEELKNFFQENDALNKLKKVYDLERESWDNSYYIMTDQPITVIDKNLPKEGLYGYENVTDEAQSFITISIFIISIIYFCGSSAISQFMGLAR